MRLPELGLRVRTESKISFFGLSKVSKSEGMWHNTRRAASRVGHTYPRKEEKAPKFTDVFSHEHS